MTTDTLKQKLSLLEQKDNQLLVNIKKGAVQIESLQAQVKNLETEQAAVYGARLMIQELLNEEAKNITDEPVVAAT